MNRKSPFGQTLLAVSAVSGLFWSVALARAEYVGLVALIITVICGALWIIFAVRNACDFGSRHAADFVRGKDKVAKPVENPLMLDPFYRSIDAQITEAKARHKRVKHLYAKREHRVNELLGKKGVA